MRVWQNVLAGAQSWRSRSAGKRLFLCASPTLTFSSRRYIIFKFGYEVKEPGTYKTGIHNE